MRRGSRASLRFQAGWPGSGLTPPRNSSATIIRLDGDEVNADADDGDAGHATGTYIATEPERWAANVPVSQ